MDKFRYTVQLENLINHYNGQTLESKFLCYFLTWFIWLSCSGDQKTTKTCKNLVPIKERHVLVSHSLSLFEIETSDSYIIRFQQNLRKTLKDQKLKDRIFLFNAVKGIGWKERNSSCFIAALITISASLTEEICHTWHKLWLHQWQ